MASYIALSASAISPAVEVWRAPTMPCIVRTWSLIPATSLLATASAPSGVVAGRRIANSSPAETSHQIAGPDCVAQQFGHTHDELIPGRVAESVVDRLEIIQIQNKERTPGSVTAAERRWESSSTVKRRRFVLPVRESLSAKLSELLLHPRTQRLT